MINDTIDFDYAISKILHGTETNIYLQPEILKSDYINESFKQIENTLNTLYEKTRYLEDSIAYTKQFLETRINYFDNEINAVLHEIENTADSAKNLSYISYNVPFIECKKTITDRDGVSSIRPLIIKDNNLTLDYSEEKTQKFSLWSRVCDSVPYKENMSKVKEEAYRVVYLEEKVIPDGISETVYVYFDEPTMINSLNIKPSNCTIHNMIFGLINGAEEFVGDYTIDMPIDNRICTYLKFDLVCTNYDLMEYEVYKEDITDNLWSQTQEVIYNDISNIETTKSECDINITKAKSRRKDKKYRHKKYRKHGHKNYGARGILHHAKPNWNWWHEETTTNNETQKEPNPSELYIVRNIYYQEELDELYDYCNSNPDTLGIQIDPRYEYINGQSRIVMFFDTSINGHIFNVENIKVIVNDSAMSGTYMFKLNEKLNDKMYCYNMVGDHEKIGKQFKELFSSDNSINSLATGLECEIHIEGNDGSISYTMEYSTTLNAGNVNTSTPTVPVKPPTPTSMTMTMYSYIFGIDTFEIKNIQYCTDGYMISDPIVIGDLKEDEYIRLEVKHEKQDCSEISYAIIDGDREIPIAIMKEDYIENELIFENVDTRFVMDFDASMSYVPEVVKLDGSVITSNYLDAKDKLSRQPGRYSITYKTNIDNYDYKPLNNTIQIKCYIRTYGDVKKVPYISSITIKKYGEESLWINRF